MFEAEIVRCPYCVLADEFRPMLRVRGGWFFCEKCGHAVVPGNIEFRCHCQKCVELTLAAPVSIAGAES
jgi:hypothetical protein